MDNLKRILWGLCRPLWWAFPAARPSMIRLFGGRVGSGVAIGDRVAVEIPWNVIIGDRVRIEPGSILYSLGRISIDKDAVIDRGAHLCAGSHDHSDPGFALLRTPIHIGSGCVVGAESFIAPGVSMGDRASVAPRAVVVMSVPAGVVVAGNPAREESPR